MKHTTKSRRAGEKEFDLGSVSLFEGLSGEQLLEVENAAVPMAREAGSDFFHQGDRAFRFFVLSAGRVRLSQVTPEGRLVVLRYAGGGEFFGCVPLFGGTEYPATATAVTRCRALSWDRPAVERLTERHPRIALNALKLLGGELAELRERYQELATERVERRVARALLRLVRQAGKKVERGVLIEFPLSRQDLAELTGTTLHTVSRTLSGWESKGLIESGRRRILIRRPDGLLSIAEEPAD